MHMDKYSLRIIDRLIAEDWDGVISDTNKALLVNHDGPKEAARLYSGRAVALHQKRDLERAIADYTKAIELDPDDVWNYRQRARVLSECGANVRALEDCNKALEIDPENHVSYKIRGEIRFAQKEYDLVIADCTKSIELNLEAKDPHAAMKLRAEAYRALGNTELAALDEKQYNDGLLSNANLMIEQLPEDPIAYRTRGELLLILKDYASAVADFDMALKLNPSDSIALEMRASAQAGLGRDSLANVNEEPIE